MSRSLGLALEVDKAGKIKRVLFNDVSDTIAVSKLFPTILHRGEFSASLDFLNRLRNERMLVDVPLAIEVGEQVKSFYFTGVKNDDDYVLIASSDQGMDSSIYDEIAKVNNELANQLRESMKSNMQRSGAVNEPGLDEFSKLNNELVNTQRELSKSNKRLASLIEQKNELIGIAAHDLRNPLAVISGYIQFVKGTSDNLNEGQLQMLDKAVDTTKKMTHMLEELLDMSELESGKVVLNLTDDDIVKLVREAVELNQVIADKKNINIHFETSGKIVLRMDASKIEQVINNFISNAVKYSHPKTQVYVTIEHDNDKVTVKVRDEGQGIPKDELKKVFEPFKTTSVKATAGEKSTGLGLAITRKVIEAHKGTIGVSSEVNVGTEFHFSLPKSL